MNVLHVVPPPPPLVNGERLTQEEFHRRYEASPPHVRAELIGGIVHMPSPLRRPHGTFHLRLATVLGNYEASTPGIEGLDNATTILGRQSEPQPDLFLRVLTEYGGRTHENEGQYIVGPPEFVAEIAHSTREIDLHEKRDDYRRTGVLEYLVVCIEEQEVHWTDFRSGRPVRLDRAGVGRSRVFPGLWLDVPALFARDTRRLQATLNQGLAAKAHGAFVKKLEATRRRLARRAEREGPA